MWKEGRRVVTVHELRFLLWSVTCRRHNPKRALGTANARFASIGVTQGAFPHNPKAPYGAVLTVFGVTPAGFGGDVSHNSGLRGEHGAPPLPLV